MLNRKNRLALLAALGLALAPLSTRAFAADTTTTTTTGATTTTKPKKTRTPKEKKTKSAELPKRTAATLERINGKPLTDAQKTAALQAQNDYTASLKALDAKRDADFASALGITADEYAARAKASKPAKTSAPATTTTPSTTPAPTTPAQ